MLPVTSVSGLVRAVVDSQGCGEGRGKRQGAATKMSRCGVARGLPCGLVVLAAPVALSANVKMNHGLHRLPDSSHEETARIC